MPSPEERLNSALEGRYRIERELGEGGMATVYLAEDLKHRRKVALKVLRPELAAVVGADRFLTEITTTANLQHPHILPLHDSGEADGFLFFVMPYVEGDTLREKIDRERQLPVGEAVAITEKVASALQYAHDHEVVHRDVKPGNILLSESGEPMVADFGIALAVAQAGGGRVTETGLSLGTPHYMSPEQASGERDVDPRTDVYALGCVLYEMLTGEPPYTGTSAQAVLAKILTGAPVRPRKARSTIPPHVDSAIRKALEKLPADRFGSVQEFAEALSDSSFRYGVGAGTGTRDTAASEGRPARTVAAAAIGCVFGIALAGTAAWLLTGSPSDAPQRLSMVLPPNRTMATGWYPGRSLTISPDGRTVVYVGGDPNVPRPGAHALVARSLDDREVRELPGTGRSAQPFFSPDGQWVGFFTNQGELRKVPLTGGNSVEVAEDINGSLWGFGTWTDDDRIVFATGGGTGGLYRVSADGGVPEQFTVPDTARGEEGHGYPEFVSDSRAILFAVSTRGLGDPRIEAVTLDTGERSVVAEDAWLPHYLESGHLLFRRGEAMLVAPFDSESLEITGPAVPLVDEVRGDRSDGSGPLPQLAVSDNGTLAYVPAPGDIARRLGIVHREDGRFEPFGPQTPGLDNPVPRISPDGRYVAFVIDRGSEDEVHIYDVERGTINRLTQEGSDSGPAWHPNGRELSVTSETEDGTGIFLEDLNGGSRLLLPGGDRFIRRNASWSPDGRTLAYTLQDGDEHDIWLYSMDDDSSRPLLEAPYREHTPRFSPDGRWLSYVSDQSGQPQVYVRGFPDGERYTASTSTGNGPVWGPDGDELFFQGEAPDGTPSLLVVSVTAEGEALRLGTPTPVLEWRVLGPTGTVEQYDGSNNVGSSYDVFPDGQRLVIARGPATDPTEIVLVQNFFEELGGDGVGVR